MGISIISGAALHRLRLRQNNDDKEEETYGIPTSHSCRGNRLRWAGGGPDSPGEQFLPSSELRASGHQLRYRSAPPPDRGIQADAKNGRRPSRLERRMASLLRRIGRQGGRK